MDGEKIPSILITAHNPFLFQHLQMDAFWTQPKMTLDYLQYLRRYTEDTGDEDLNWIKMNDNFIVAWESSTGLFKCWSRRTLSPIDMDKVKEDYKFYKTNYSSTTSFL